MKNKIILLSLLLVSLTIDLQAQMQKEIFGSDYSFIGKSNSDASGDITFEKYEIRASFPIKLKKPGLRLIQSLRYARTNIDYGIKPFSGTELESFHSIAYTLCFSKPLKKGWYFTAFISPNISSNFQSSVNWDEIRLFGMALFSKPINKKRNLVLSLGALYSTTLGAPTPIPIASLMWKPNQKWTINFGFPRFDIQYQLSSATTIGTNLFVMGENFTLTNDIAYDGNNSKIDNIKIMNIGGGLFLNQKITKMIKLNLNSGYTFYRQFNFQDGQNTVVDYKLNHNLYIKGGISVGF
ncbi:DUF6268 family outer membrane beta-barrel protein [Ancylomarina longa]|uniref:DUF6268 domain-containing protein n=1 Tax=Ancylomarina longa TaxID=2487017 RepID=A0A434AEX7_9BACT|nr:DUF6268 family outer membrane beta-barrel protein [Ancylomarina longa]RUT72898.1 hypothetical protein DLK05_16055 [Ancylomarina longa]